LKSVLGNASTTTPSCSISDERPCAPAVSIQQRLFTHTKLCYSSKFSSRVNPVGNFFM
jgi:hypothetical protein